MEDFLHKNNPWSGADCGRGDCLSCLTKLSLGKNKRQDCRKRSLVYEIWCQQCASRMEKEVEEKGLSKEEEEAEKQRLKIPKYIGESSRSTYERSFEHREALRSINSNSFMVKHWMENHEHESIEEERYAMKVLKFTQTSFERQILESVIIQEEKKKSHLLNSKSEYNRCAVPRLTSRIGTGRMDEEEKLEKRREDLLEEKIRKVRKKIMNERRNTERVKYVEDLQIRPLKRYRQDGGKIEKSQEAGPNDIGPQTAWVVNH